jgi:hypothetical protein
MSINDTRIHLISTWVWTCPACEYRNEHGGCSITDPVVLAELREQVGNGSEGFAYYPDRVACHKCETVFATDADDEDEDEIGEDDA